MKTMRLRSVALKASGDRRGYRGELLTALRSVLLMDDYENAVAVLQKADQNDESIKSALLEARISYGQYCYDEGKNDQAIETLKAVIDEAPDRIDAYSMLITVYVDTGKAKEAESIVQSGLERFVNQNSTVTG